MTDTQHPLADALRAIAEGNLGDMPWQANYERIRKVAADALSQYEKSDTDRDQLREAAQALITSAKLLQANCVGCAMEHHGADFANEGLPGWLDDTQRDIDSAIKAVAALASKTAIDPVTVEADTACNHIIAARTFLVISEPDHADRHLKAALRSLGSQS